MLFQIKTINGQKKIVPLTADTGTGAPVGSLIAMYKKSSPSGYLYCDGSTFDETKYPALYQYLGSNVLPDYREFALVGAEQNTTDTIATHDVFAQGQFKDDCIQDFGIEAGQSGGTAESLTRGNNRFYTKKLSEVSADARTGNVTRGKRKAVYFYIKATSGLTENQQENVLNTINENLSYSTTEHKTGKKWIDGKDIYERTIEYGDGTTIIPQDTEITILNNVSIDKLIKWSGTSIYDSSVDYVLPNRYVMMYNRHTNIGYAETSMQSKKLSVTLEYTKTTD